MHILEAAKSNMSSNLNILCTCFFFLQFSVIIHFTADLEGVKKWQPFFIKVLSKVILKLEQWKYRLGGIFSGPFIIKCLCNLNLPLLRCLSRTLHTLIKTYTWSLWSEKNIGKINCIFDKFCYKLKGPSSTNVNFGLFGDLQKCNFSKM